MAISAGTGMRMGMCAGKKMKPILFRPEPDTTPTYVEFSRDDRLAIQRGWIEKELQANWPDIEIISFEQSASPLLVKLRVITPAKQVIPILFSTNRDEASTRQILSEVLRDTVEAT